MIALFGIALLVAFIALVLASLLPSPHWLWALDGVVIGLAVALFSAAGALLDRLRAPEPWKAMQLPFFSAITALTVRRWLLEWLDPPEALPGIDLWRMQLAAFSAVGAVFAVIGGIAALNRGRAWYDMVVAGVVIAIGLFAIGPIFLRAGVPVDWRAFLSLVALGLGAYAVIEAARRVRMQ